MCPWTTIAPTAPRGGGRQGPGPCLRLPALEHVGGSQDDDVFFLPQRAGSSRLFLTPPGPPGRPAAQAIPLPAIVDHLPIRARCCPACYVVLRADPATLLPSITTDGTR